MLRVWTRLCLLVLFLVIFARASRVEAVVYSIDQTPLTSYRDLAKPYLNLQAEFEKGPLTEEQHRERLAVLQRILREEPTWGDGYGLFAGEAFMLASSFQAPAEQGKARRLLDEAIAMSQEGLKVSSHSLLSQFFLAASLAKKSAIDGVMSSLRYGARIHELWHKVMSSQQELWFRPNVSLQGSVRYGLGMFYRLVPDQWMMQRLFAIRGSLDRSIELHRQGLMLNPQDPCASLMLAASLLCQARRQAIDIGPEVTELMDNVQRLPSFDKIQSLCHVDAKRLKQNPDMACTYAQQS